MYNVYKIENNKLVQMFNDRSFEKLEDAAKLIGYWYTSFRSNREIEFLVISQEDGRSLILNYDTFNEK